MTCILKRQVSVCSINANYPINQQINKIDMEAKLKAKELVEKMFNVEHCTIKHFPNQNYCDCEPINYGEAKQCALISVDEVLNNMNIIREENNYNYWQQVKSEITNL